MEDDGLLLQDCFEGMAAMPDGCVDLVLTDPPYGCTYNKWDNLWGKGDKVLDLFWAELLRVTTNDAVIVCMAQDAFAARLMLRPEFRYMMVWKKSTPTNAFQAKRRPLRSHELIIVACKTAGGIYHPQMTDGHAPRFKWAGRMQRAGTNYGNALNKRADDPHVGKTTRFPTTVISHIPPEGNRSKTKFHPTQKPVPLMEYLIQMYSDEGALVFDPFMGSGTTAIACIRTGRRFFGFEKDAEYFAKATARIAAEPPHAHHTNNHAPTTATTAESDDNDDDNTDQTEGRGGQGSPSAVVIRGRRTRSSAHSHSNSNSNGNSNGKSNSNSNGNGNGKSNSNSNGSSNSGVCIPTHFKRLSKLNLKRLCVERDLPAHGKRADLLGRLSEKN